MVRMFICALALACSVAAQTVEVGGYLSYLKGRVDTTDASVSAQAATLSVVQSDVVDLRSRTNPLYIPSVTSGVTVAVSPTQSVYRISVADANTISNNLDALTLDGTKDARWELWVNYTSTNALSTQWDPRMNWGYQTPMLTVTGQYKFACSTVDGVTIQAKQVYPTAPKWEGIPAYQPTSVANLSATLYSATVLTNSIGFSAWTINAPVLVRFRTTAVDASSASIYTNLVGVYLTSSAQGGAVYNFGYISWNYTLLNFAHYPAQFYTVIPTITTPRPYVLLMRFEFTNIGGSSGAGIVASGMLERRPLNELEAAAWAATGFVPMN